MTSEILREQRRRTDARFMRDRNAATKQVCDHDWRPWVALRDRTATPGTWVECEDCGATRKVADV